MLITAANELENVKRSLHLGVLDYLVKPFLLSDFNKVSKTIRKNCSIHAGNEGAFANKSGPIISLFTDKRT